MLTETDVLIVGAGPAGCAAGTLLARQGIRVTILEKNPQGYQKICGDLLSPRAQTLLQELRVGWHPANLEVFPVHGMHIYDAARLTSAAYFDPKGAEWGWGAAVRRDRLDGFLQGAARAAGCRPHHDTVFRGLETVADNRILCRATARGREDLFRCKMVLGADGVSSAVARVKGLYRRRPQNTIVAVRGYYGDVSGLRDRIELYLMPEFQPGYAWVIPLSRKVANIGLGIRSDACVRNRIRLQGTLRRFMDSHPTLSRRTRQAHALRPVQGWPISTYDGSRKLSAAHLLLVGEAAGLVDPLSGEGIFGALRSGQLAATAVQEALRKDDFSAGFLAAYDRSCRAAFRADYGAAAFLTGLLAYRFGGKRLAMWGVRRVQMNCLMDPQYAGMVAGFFTATVPRRRFFTPRWMVKTLIG